MMEGAHENLLVDPIIRVTMTDGRAKIVSLPGLYELLMADKVSAVTALRPHQKHPLHAFLVQAGALALVAAGESEPPETAAEWAALLRGLTPDFPGDEPWALVVPDLSKPALLQPPVPEGTLDGWKDSDDEPTQALTPDELDVITKGRQHDLKSGRMINSCADDWLFALISVQTAAAQNGRPYKASARSPSGDYFRPFVGLGALGGTGVRVKRDIIRLIEQRGQMLESTIGYDEQGISLVWMRPWNGKEQIKRNELDIFYIEICRRIRLLKSNGGIFAKKTSSEKDRILEPDGFEGRTGDPWAPLSRQKEFLLPIRVSEQGFHYSIVARLMNKKSTKPAPLQEVAAADGKIELHLVFSGIGVEKQGVSGGYHEKIVRVKPKQIPFLSSEPLGDISEQRVNQAGLMQEVVLKSALRILRGDSIDDVENDANKQEERILNKVFKIKKRKITASEGIQKFLDVLDREIDRDFFDDLFAELEEEDRDAKEKVRADWLLKLKRHAEDILATAEAGSPQSLVRRYQSRAAAERALQGAFYRVFKDYFPKSEDKKDE